MEKTGKLAHGKTSNSEVRTRKRIKWDEMRTVRAEAREGLSQERRFGGRRDRRGQRDWKGDPAPEVPQAAGVVGAERARRETRPEPGAGTPGPGGGGPSSRDSASGDRERRGERQRCPSV